MVWSIKQQSFTKVDEVKHGKREQEGEGEREREMERNNINVL